MGAFSWFCVDNKNTFFWAESGARVCNKSNLDLKNQGKDPKAARKTPLLGLVQLCITKELEFSFTSLEYEEIKEFHGPAFPDW